jgi:transcriptional regulator with XRE-family HTH domain
MVDLRVWLGLRLEELRNWANLSRPALEKLTNIDVRKIAGYELEGVWPDPETLTVLATGLGIKEIRDLFDFSDTRVRSMLPLEERLAKRGQQRSDRGRTRSPGKRPPDK